MSENIQFEDGSFQRLLSMMQRLLQTPDGKQLYERIEHGSRVCEDMNSRLEHQFLVFIDDELEQYLKAGDPEPATRMVARLIRRRLAPFLGQNDNAGPAGESPFAKLEDNIAEVMEQAGQLEEWREATKLVEKEERASQARFNIPADDDMLDLAARKQELIGRYDEMQAAFDKSKIGNRDFLNNLKTIRLALSSTTDSKNIDEWKPLLLDAIDEIIDWQEGMMSQLREVAGFLDEVRTSNSSLHEEIIKVRQLTQTDEFTGLPNHDAFTRRLYGEMQRARRFRHPLTVCLLGLDLSVTDGLDEQAAEIVTLYADDVISQFRGYDIVARTDALQFGVILPGTDVEGALKALAEAQYRAARNQAADGRQSLPSFHSGIADMHPNDDPDELLARAQKAYRQAAKAGPQTLEVISGESGRNTGSANQS